MREILHHARIFTLQGLLGPAQAGGYAVGAFSPRVLPLIPAVLRAAEAQSSPVIVQIAQGELELYQIQVGEFAAAFYEWVEKLSISVPLALHLDHTKHFDLITAAIAAGFSSVMIDASDRDLADNILITRQVVEYAHERGVSVEAELGRIASADEVESDEDDELYTDPGEAAFFVECTGVDALAVSVGTAHGVCIERPPRIDLERLRAIRAETAVNLVLHGGSGNPAELIQRAVRLPGGGVSKINIATDLELAFLRALDQPAGLTNSQAQALSVDALARGREAVEQVVDEKMCTFLESAGRAQDYGPVGDFCKQA